MNEVVVTGLGFICSIGNDESAVIDSLRTLKSGIAEHPELVADPMSPVRLAGVIADFKLGSRDPEDWEFPSEYQVNRAFLRRLSPHVLYAYCALQQAVEAAGLSPEAISNERTGLYTASAGSASSLTYFTNRMNQLGVERCNPNGIVASVVGTLNFNLVSQFKIHGSSAGFVSACASSGHALGFAYDEIVSGRQDRMLVVGAEDGDRETLLPFAGIRALTLNPDPRTAARPFDKDRDGFVGTGGAAAVILESRESAEARGAPIHARISGWGQSSDGYNPVLPLPDGSGLARATRQALAAAGWDAGTVDYVNAHAPSTQMGDLAEIRALQQVFGDAGNGPAISSTKSLSGHGLSLASILEAGFTILGLREGFLPGTQNLEEPDQEAEGLNLLKDSIRQQARRALSNSSGFGGANVVLALESP
jgi:3-oxoacyl-[acyl-carrier-protein] synthase-1